MGELKARYLPGVVHPSVIAQAPDLILDPATAHPTPTSLIALEAWRVANPWAFPAPVAGAQTQIPGYPLADPAILSAPPPVWDNKPMTEELIHQTLRDNPVLYRSAVFQTQVKAFLLQQEADRRAGTHL